MQSQARLVVSDAYLCNFMTTSTHIAEYLSIVGISNSYHCMFLRHIVNARDLSWHHILDCVYFILTLDRLHSEYGLTFACRNG